MFISTPFALIIVVVVVVILILIVWNLSHNALPQGRDLACGTGGSCPPGFRCAAGICLANGTCRSNNDCTGGDLCISGHCQECGSDDQCPVGSTCTNGRCGVMPCQREEDCPNGFFCDDETSQTPNVLSLCRPVTCQNNADCLAGQACQNGVCMTLGTICSNDRDCRSGSLRCMNGRCQQCQQNSDCPSGSCLIQDSASGVAQVGMCVTACHPQCPTGQRCVNGDCIPDTPLCGNQCSSSQDCTSGCPFCHNGLCVTRGKENGDYCQDNQDCNSGNCQHGRCQEKGAECMIGDTQSTCPADRPHCVNGRCRASAEGLICVPPTQDFSNGRGTQMQACPHGFYCVNGLCRSHHGRPGDRCEETTDCMQGSTCDDVTFGQGRSEKRCRRARRS